jgi:hypothetical protein
LRQSRVISKDRVVRDAGAQLPKHQFYRDARAANNRLAVHNVAISLDPIVRHGTLFALI